MQQWFWGYFLKTILRLTLIVSYIELFIFILIISDLNKALHIICLCVKKTFFVYLNHVFRTGGPFLETELMCSFIVVHERSITKCDLINNIIKTILPRSIGLF
jgi:hypothetical protein